MLVSISTVRGNGMDRSDGSGERNGLKGVNNGIGRSNSSNADIGRPSSNNNNNNNNNNVGRSNSNSSARRGENDTGTTNPAMEMDDDQSRRNTYVFKFI